MSATNDFKEQHIDQYCEWVAENKFSELEGWCEGNMFFCKDTYEDCLDAYLESPDCDHWEEYINTLPQNE